MDHGETEAVAAVLGALAAGGGQGLSEIAKQATVESWQRLVNSVRAIFVSRHDHVAEAKLTVMLAEPSERNAESLRRHLSEAGIDSNTDLLALAHEVLAGVPSVAVGQGSVAAAVINANPAGLGTVNIGGVHFKDTDGSFRAASASTFLAESDNRPDPT